MGEVEDGEDRDAVLGRYVSRERRRRRKRDRASGSGNTGEVGKNDV